MNKNDIEILRELGKKKAEIASLPQNAENENLWKKTNDLDMVKPPIFIDEVCWNEMNVNDELTIKTVDPFCQKIETELRREIYSFKHMPVNMVVKNEIDSPIIVIGDNFSISEDVDIVETDKTSDVVSRHFNVQIKDEDDICKIKDPVISIDEATTNENFAKMEEIFSGILKVNKAGKRGMWFTPWDSLIRWTGIEQIMFDLIERPEYVEALVDRFVDASISLLNQYKTLGLWASNNKNIRVGSGGYGYSKDLKNSENYNTNAPTKELWGCGNAQIFSSVSEQMHWDFSLKQEIRWLENFGLNYYGCCEPLHNKLNIVEKIPNLRKLSVSPWCDIPKVNERAKDKYVLSCKPSPAIFVAGNFNEVAAKADIKRILDESKGCNIELILKDISTVNYEPENLWKWAKLAVDTINENF